MIDDRKILGVIIARGQSKGLPRKNILDLGGKPVIAWSIESARDSRHLDRTVFSTEDKEIADIARRHGGDVPFLRPADLASDESLVEEAVIHAVDALEETYEFAVLLQASSPLRTGADIDACIEHCVRRKASACAAVTIPGDTPYKMYTMDDGERLIPAIDQKCKIQRRQDLPVVYKPNGCVFVAEIDWLRRSGLFLNSNTIGYLMPADRSIDIDTIRDLQLARLIVNGDENL